MSAPQLTNREVVESALRAARFLLVKHSPICPVSDKALRECERFVEAHPDVPTGWIDVIGHRPLSRWIADATGVKHESPQALWIENGVVVWNASHFSITENALTAACTGGHDDDVA